MNNNNFEGAESFVKVRFTTGSSTNITAPSPKRKIKGHYHFGKDGDIIWVHVDDQKARPDLYKLVEAEPKPPTRKRRRKTKAVEEAQ